MPQTRRTSNRRKKNSAQNKNIAKIAKRVLHQNSETKLKMNHLNEVSLSSLVTGQYWDPMIIPEGTGVDERIGNQITLSGHQIKGVLNNNTTAHAYVRMALFTVTDRADVGSASEIFINSAHTPLTSTTIGGLDMMYHPFNKSYMKILNEKVFKLAPNSTGNTGGTRFFNMFTKLHNRKIEYEHNQTGTTNNVSPRLHLGVWTAGASDDDASITIELSAMQRLWYKDI